MPNVTVNVPHQLTRAEARRRIDDGLVQFRQNRLASLGNLDSRWEGDTLKFTFTAAGQSLPGLARVEDHLVYIEVELPWIFAMLANTVRHQLTNETQKLLERK